MVREEASYSLSDARARIGEVVDRAWGGEDVRLTNRGRTVAWVISEETMDEMIRLRHLRDIADKAWQEALDEATSTPP